MGALSIAHHHHSSTTTPSLPLSSSPSRPLAQYLALVPSTSRPAVACAVSQRWGFLATSECNDWVQCGRGRGRPRRLRPPRCSARAQHAGKGPLRIMISGAPASGKGTQCELIAQQYQLTHISAGDLLRAEVASGTEAGREAQEYMQKGLLVPNEIVVTMVKNKLSEAQTGWLLDGYPRSLSQAQALQTLDIHPQLFILLEVPDEVLIQRVVGRRLDPVTGKIYHLMYSPPETLEIAARLTQRMDDTEEKVILRLKTHNSNVEAVMDAYKSVIKHVDGNRPKDQVFADIKDLIAELEEEAEKVGAQVVTGGH